LLQRVHSSQVQSIGHREIAHARLVPYGEQAIRVGPNFPLSCENAMNHVDVVKHMTSALASRREIFDVSLDRGMGRSTQMEDWIITEMLAKLIELRNRGLLEQVEGEHSYQLTKNTTSARRSYERCDFWWELKGQGHWLEVKTIHAPYQQRSLDGISTDLQKCKSLAPGEIPHHLTIVYPLRLSQSDYWRNELVALYGHYGWKLESDWHYPMWDPSALSFFLFSVG
jgi:hypothetical protein